MSLPIHLCEVAILFLSVWFHSASCDIFYIVTTANSPCPGEFIGVPCLTLQQYAANPSRSENITFQVEPGTYYLSTELTVSNGYNFTMSSSNATVTCTSSTARFSFDSVENVHISGMTFQMCRNSAIKMTSVTEAYITNSSFVGNVHPNSSYRYGGAIYAYFSTIIIIDQSIFIDNSASASGGAIYCYALSSTITIVQTTFSGNSAASGSGGAIYAPSSKVITDLSVFSGNRAYNGHGGAIHAYFLAVNLSTFDYNLASIFRYYYTSPLGGAIKGESVAIDRSVFSHNTVNGTGGGAIHGRNVSVESSVFSHNTALSYNYRNNAQGGAIYCDGKLQVSNTTIDNNRVASGGGGALFATNLYTGNTSVTNSQFINNTVSGDGGAITILDNYGGNISITKCRFIRNIAGGDGGAIRFYGANIIMSITNCHLINNTAGRNGGAIILHTYALYVLVNAP